MTYDAVQVKTSRIDIRVSEDLLRRVDERREELGQTRTKFIERALESALGNPSVGRAVEPRASAATAPDPGLKDSAPSRASASVEPTTERELQGLRNIYESLVPAAATPQRKPAKKKPAAGGLPSIAPRHWGAK
jgi:predicted transcriptional regulator